MRKMAAFIILIVVAIGIIPWISTRLKEGDEQMVLENISSTVNNLSITVVYDNYPYKEGLATGWGFSCLIRGTEKTILFDTGGDGSILLENMKKLGIRPKDIDLIVLSHIHGDHVGGLASILETNPDVIVYLPKSFAQGFKQDVMRYGAKVVEVQESLKICENVYSTGELGTWIKEQSLIIHTDKGLIVITGCAHLGIVKIASTSKDLVKDDILFVMGGFHLAGESRKRIEEIVLSFKKLGVRHVSPCHCSGDAARQLFEKEYNQYFINVGVGKMITLEDLK